jgi:hypothetical protein
VNSLSNWSKERLEELWDILEEVIVLDLTPERLAGLRQAMELISILRCSVITTAIFVQIYVKRNVSIGP